MRFATAFTLLAASAVHAAVFNVDVGANNMGTFNPNNITGAVANDTIILTL
jgi:hypothetical protein